MGTVPKSTKADIKFFFGLSLQRIGIAIMVGFVAISLVLSGRSPSNPRITFAKGLILFVLNFFEPKKLYGTETEEYRTYKEREAERNAKKQK